VFQKNGHPFCFCYNFVSRDQILVIFTTRPLCTGRRAMPMRQAQEQEKLRISNLASAFRGSMRTKAHEKFLEKSERGRIQGLLNFGGYPLLSQQREKLLISNLASTFRGSMILSEQSPLKILDKGSVGVSRDCPNFFGQYIQRVHPNRSP